MRLGMVAALTLMLTYSATVSLAAECVAIHPRDEKQRAGRVLEGTVTRVEGAGSRAPVIHAGGVATVTVQRVWKGALTPEATIYFDEEMHAANLRLGERRIFFGMLMDPNTRTRFGIPADAPPSFFVGCSGAPKPEPIIVRQLGRARIVPSAQRN